MLNLDDYDRKNGIYVFRGKYRFLSNFYPFQMGEYKSNEHYYMSHKTLDEKLKRDIIESPTASQAKLLGKLVTLRSDWEKIKDSVMYDGLMLKFSYPEMQDMLLETGNFYIQETNTWGDTYWGVCKNKGQNKLGNLLMNVRSHYSR